MSSKKKQNETQGKRWAPRFFGLVFSMLLFLAAHITQSGGMAVLAVWAFIFLTLY